MGTGTLVGVRRGGHVDQGENSSPNLNSSSTLTYPLFALGFRTDLTPFLPRRSRSHTLHTVERVYTHASSSGTPSFRDTVKKTRGSVSLTYEVTLPQEVLYCENTTRDGLGGEGNRTDLLSTVHRRSDPYTGVSYTLCVRVLTVRIRCTS